MHRRPVGVFASEQPLLTNIFGQCRLTKSSTNLLLSPFGGNLLTINGWPCIIPDAGITLAVSGASLSTTYFIYATASSGQVNTLEFSATAYAVSTAVRNKGVYIKSGDDTRTLVGMARTTAGTAWADSATQIFVISWFNRSSKDGVNNFTTDRTSTSTSYAEINSEIRVEFITWATEAVWASITGTFFNSGANALETGIGFDGTTATVECGGTGTGANTIGLSTQKTLSEGYHYATLIGKVAAGTGTWYGSGSRVTNRVNVMVRG